MHFILILNKRSAAIEVDNILNNGACTYKSETFTKHDVGHITCVCFEYNSFLNCEYIRTTKDELTLIKGVVTGTASNTSPDPEIDFENNKNDYSGDYLALKINESGNGKILRPLMSYHQLFHCIVDNTHILATDLKLIVKSVTRYYSSPLVQNYDSNFITESILNEWGERKYPHSTFLKDITRIQTIDEVSISNFEVEVTRKNLNHAPLDRNMEMLYLTNKSFFYSMLIKKTIQSTGYILRKLNIKEIIVNLTGGLDSRLTLAVLLEIKKHIELDIKAQTYGPPTHPDVQIAKQVASSLSIEHIHHQNPEASSIYPKSIEDYQKCFKYSLGDWNSNNFSSLESIFVNGLKRLHGQDSYKKLKENDIYSKNRWGAKRLACQDILPVLMNFYVNQTVLIYRKHKPLLGKYEFVESFLKAINPQLLEIPFVGCSLPNSGIAPYSTIEDSKMMPAMEKSALYDEKLIVTTLPFFRENTLLENIAKRTKINLLIKLATIASNLFFNKGNALPSICLNDERKRRIAMDYASASNLYGNQI